ncbi:DUF998 domain-containing protein [Microlunatus sp. GCM10028923]|uniref:DUF998 domain-containing protein n=1 Tax=Microlunatus sp. GCM10028923 TaxID=3273400 RepID=UPI003605C36E
MKNTLLLAGAIAGPLYVGIGTVEALVRDGFDLRIHPLSVLANGPGGWVHSAMMITTGLLTVLGVAGLRGAVPRVTAIGLLIYGLGVTAAGMMTADPVAGFPPGTPTTPPETISWHGLGHFLAGAIGFLGLIVAALALAWWQRKNGRPGWAVFSLITGVFYLASFVGIGASGGRPALNIAFSVAVALGWTWITLLMLRNRTAGPRS